MADSVTTQQADIKKLLAEADAKREAYEKLLAEAKAIIANSQLKREGEAHEKALAEAKREAEAHEKALAEAKHEARKKALAEPFLTTSQWLSVAIFIAASLARF